jgi:hypothetical protein
MTYEVGMQVRVVAVPHDYCSPRIGDILTVTGVMDHGVMATTHAGLQKHYSFREQGKYHLFFPFNAVEPVVEDMGKTLKELDVKPGDVVKCVDNGGCYWWTIGKTYAVTADGTPADDEGYIYGDYDDPQPAVLFTAISRAGETKVQKKEDDTEVFYGLDSLGFFDVKPSFYNKRLVLNHTTGTFTLERI